MGYLKVRDRASYEFALASAAVALVITDGVMRDTRVALGGLATIPWRSQAAEDVLRGAVVRPERDCKFNGVTPETEETPVTDVTTSHDEDGAELSAADEQLLRELTERARTGGSKMTGEGGLLGKLTKMVVEGALEGELDDHLGYGKHDPGGPQRQQFPQWPPRQDRAHRDGPGGDFGAAGP